MSWEIKAIVAAIGLVLILAAYEYAPWVGPRARVERMEGQRDDWRKAAEGWQASALGWQSSFRDSEALREREGGRALVAVNEAEASCQARITEARRAGRAIAEIVHAPVANDDAGNPVRGVVDPGVLRDALGARAPG